MDYILKLLASILATTCCFFHTFETEIFMWNLWSADKPKFCQCDNYSVKSNSWHVIIEIYTHLKNLKRSRRSNKNFDNLYDFTSFNFCSFKLANIQLAQLNITLLSK